MQKLENISFKQMKKEIFLKKYFFSLKEFVDKETKNICRAFFFHSKSN